MSKRNSAVNSNAAAAATAKAKPDVIELDEAEKISLSVLIESIRAKQVELQNLQTSQAKILAKIETANGLEAGTLAKEYQFVNGQLVRPIA